MRALRCGGLFVLALLAGAPPVRAQATIQPGGISGVVSTEIGTALPGAAAVIRDARARIVAQMTTGDDGRFTVVGLADGSYRISVSLRDFLTANAVALVAGSTAQIRIALQPALEEATIVAQTEVLTTGNALAS